MTDQYPPPGGGSDRRDEGAHRDPPDEVGRPAGAGPSYGAEGPYAAQSPYGAPGTPGGYGSDGPGSGGWGAAGGYGGYGAPPPRAEGTNVLAIIALVSAFLIGIVGVVLGFVARAQVKRTGQGGGGLATAAIVVGALNMALGACLVAGGGAQLGA